MIRFWKYQAIGNDFPLFEASDLTGVNLAELAQIASDRMFGIGGDGILVMQPIDRQHAELRMFNPDGTEDFCGNGLRIAALHAFTQDWVGTGFELRHLDRNVPVRMHDNGSISTTIGSADYNPLVVPVDRPNELFDDVITTIGELRFVGSSLTTGSTHTVIPVSELPTNEQIEAWGPIIENLPQYPERTSVIFAQEEGPGELRIRVWERGVGETQGCGTGSSAAAADYLRRRSSGGGVLVRNPGGSIEITMDHWDSPITITGTAEFVYRGNFRFGAENGTSGD